MMKPNMNKAKNENNSLIYELKLGEEIQNENVGQIKNPEQRAGPRIWVCRIKEHEIQVNQKDNDW